ncbi:hypothetical protein GWN63_01285, partial [Candidatus Bathyarchaeota archaeon]|nr:metal-dependent hydrolase [Candidatus Bathyarchaeota archaeon]NIR12716.1 metal-dependent hydrolase [Desulfobacterales bacterium]NIU80870.1 hypothetical protein [Candidatus Bathyarchaeota archaeon]NIV67800.1 hypothetical protein [Candidatus Bathyarchaeota archaeon]NIW34208.1 hypothetical protein [Candidatus Bathyarchaeota archaeon]
MYAVGHLALGYLTGKATGRLLKLNPNLPLLFLASILPDIDLLIPGVEHRGPTHSLVLAMLLFLPLFTYFRKQALPYLVALIQHSLIGDLVTGGGIQLLYPLKNHYYQGLPLQVTGLPNVLLEWIFFLTCFSILLKTRDAWTLLRSHLSNLTLSIPGFTVLLPTFLSFPL